jgi:hypothetical protein
MNKNISISLLLQSSTRNAVFISSSISEEHRKGLLNLLDRIATTPPYLIPFQQPIIDAIIILIWRLLLLDGEEDAANWIFSYICRISIVFGNVMSDMPPAFILPPSIIAPDHQYLILRIAFLLNVRCEIKVVNIFVSVSITSGIPTACFVFKHLLSVLNLCHYVVIGAHPQRDQAIEFIQAFSW